MQKFIRAAFQNELYAVMFGGAGYEHDISLKSAENFIKTAAEEGFCIMPVYIDKFGEFYIFDGNIDDINEKFSPSNEQLISTFPIRIGNKSGFFAKGNLIEVRLAIPVLHGDFGEDGRVQGLLESAKIPFIGADTICGALSADKAYTKAVAESIGIPVVEYFVFLSNTENSDDCIKKAESLYGYPVFIKPCRLGSSIGASKAMCREDLIKALSRASEISNRILIEPAVVNKRELECAYFAIGDIKMITEPGEAVSNSDFYDYNAKYRSLETTLFPKAKVKLNIKKQLIEYTEQLANALDVRHIARFDYFLTSDEKIYFNEINTFPGMTKASLYAAMLDMSGMNFRTFIKMLLTKGDL